MDNIEKFESFMADRFGDSIDRRRCLNGDGNDYMAWDMQVAKIVWMHVLAQLEAPQKLAQHYLEQRDAAEQVSASALRDWAKEGQRAEKAEAELSAANEKLSKPVKLPKTNGYWDAEEQAFERGIQLACQEIRIAGFRVEGDE